MSLQIASLTLAGIVVTTGSVVALTSSSALANSPTPAPSQNSQTDLTVISTVDLQANRQQIPWGQAVIIRDPFDGDTVKVFDRSVISGTSTPSQSMAQERTLISEWSSQGIKVHLNNTTQICGIGAEAPVASGVNPFDALGMVTSVAPSILGAGIGSFGALGALSSVTGVLGGLFGGGESAPEPQMACQAAAPEMKLPAQTLELKVGQSVVQLQKEKDYFAVTPEIAFLLRTTPASKAYLRATFPNMPTPSMPTLAEMQMAPGTTNDPVLAEISTNTINAWRTVFKNSNPATTGASK